MPDKKMPDRKMADRQNDRLAKWHIGKMTHWQNDTLTKWHIGKMTHWQNDTLKICHIGKNDKMTKWPDCRVTKWTKWQNGQITFDKMICKLNYRKTKHYLTKWHYGKMTSRQNALLTK